jgi:hypothetical protein
MTDRVAWLEARAAAAPAALRHRVLQHLTAAPPTGDLAGDLAAAARTALDLTLREGGTRDAALDLLAADALVTLALLAGAERDPAGLAGFARQLRTTEGPA